MDLLGAQVERRIFPDLLGVIAAPSENSRAPSVVRVFGKYSSRKKDKSCYRRVLRVRWRFALGQQTLPIFSGKAFGHLREHPEGLCSGSSTPRRSASGRGPPA